MCGHGCQVLRLASGLARVLVQRLVDGALMRGDFG